MFVHVRSIHFLRIFFKWGLFMTGLFLLALGSSIMITANLGVSTWDVLHIGIAHHLPISIGTVILCVGLLLVLFKYILDRVRPQFGTLVNAVFVGVFMNLILNEQWLPVFEGMMVNIIWLTFGIFVMGMGAGLYVAVGYGAGPRDGLTLALADRFNTSVRAMRTWMELTACLIGWALGGPLFFGTVLSIFLIGPFFQFWLERFRLFIAYVDRLKVKFA